MAIDWLEWIENLIGCLYVKNNLNFYRLESDQDIEQIWIKFKLKNRGLQMAQFTDLVIIR